jgi:hypothetical protein
MSIRMRRLGAKVAWLLGLVGHINLVYTIVVGGAAAAVFTAAVAYGVSFLEFVSGIPLFFRVLFYASVFTLFFALFNHGRQWLPSWWARLRLPPDDELKRRCLQLSAALDRFATLRDRHNTSLKFYWQRQRPDISEGEKEQLHAKEISTALSYTTETINLYNERYAQRVMRLYEDLERRGWCYPEDRRFFEPLTDKMGGEQAIYTVARRLEAIGHERWDEFRNV